MAKRNRGADRPLEESPEVAAAVEDESTAPALRTGGGPDTRSPAFVAPGETPAQGPSTENLIGAAAGGGSDNAADWRTGAEQPWEPEDLAAAQGHDPTPENVERARRELERDGPAAVERTVP